MNRHHRNFGPQGHQFNPEEKFRGPRPEETGEETGEGAQFAHHRGGHRRHGPHFGFGRGRAGGVRPPFFGPGWGGPGFGGPRGFGPRGRWGGPFFGPWGMRRGPFGPGFGHGRRHGWGGAEAGPEQRREWGGRGFDGPGKGEGRGWGGQHRHGRPDQGQWGDRTEERIARLERFKSHLERKLEHVNTALEQLRAQQKAKVETPGVRPVEGGETREL